MPMQIRSVRRLRRRLGVAALLFAIPVKADEVTLLFRARPEQWALEKIASRFGPHQTFTELPISLRERFQHLVDPLGVGHVAIRFRDPLSGKTKTLGWTPADAETYADAEKIIAKMMEGSIYDFKEPVPGGFRDDTEWAYGATWDPVFEIPLFATPQQVQLLFDEIKRYDAFPWYSYQLLPTFNREKNTWSYGPYAFNCVEGIRRVLAAAQIRLPFAYPLNGSMMLFTEAAKPHVKRTSYGKYCFQPVAANDAH